MMSSPSTSMPSHRVLLLALAGAIIVSLLPALGFSLTDRGSWVSPWIYGLLIAATTIAYSWRWALLLPWVAGVLAIPATLLSTSPFGGAALMGAVAATIGLSALIGRHGVVGTIGTITAFVLVRPAEVDPGAAPVVNGALEGLIIGVAGIWVVGIWALFVRRTMSSTPPIDRRPALVYTATMMLIIIPSTWWVLTYERTYAGGWLLMTIFIIMQPSIHDSLRRSLERAVGTVIGVVVAGILAYVVTAPTIGLVVGGALLYAAYAVRFIYSDPYWQYVSLLTPGVVLLSSIGTDIDATAADRLGNTLAAVVIVAVSAYSISTLTTISQRRRNTTAA